MQKKKLIKIIVINTLSASIIACNNGSKNSVSAAKITTSTNKQKITDKKVKDFSEYEEAPLKLPVSIQLGYGFNPDDNSFRIPAGVALNRMVSQHDISSETDEEDKPKIKPVVIIEPVEYNEYGKFAGVSDGRTIAHAKAFAGGVAVNYGLYNLNIKGDYSAASETRAEAAKITKLVGMVYSSREHMPYDGVATPTELSRMRTAEAFLVGVGGLKTALDQITAAKNHLEREKALARFYSNFGTHAIVSVTKGYTGSEKIIFTKVSSAEHSENLKEFQGGISAPFAKANVGYAEMDTSKINMAEWDYDKKIYLAPADTNFYTQLTTAFAQLDADLSLAKADEAAMSTDLEHKITSGSLISNLNLVGKMQIPNDPTFSKDYKQERDNKRNKELAIKTLAEFKIKLATGIEKYHNLTDPEKITFKTDINIAEQIFLKFRDGGEYQYLAMGEDINIISQIGTLIEEANKLVSPAQLAVNKKAEFDVGAYLKFLNDTESSLVSQKDVLKEYPEIISFNDWIKSRECKGEDSFDKCLEQMPLDQILAAEIEWKQELKAKGIIDDSLTNKIRALNLQRNANLLVTEASKSLPAQHLTQNDTGIGAEPVDFDFNIVPWNSLYPGILGSQPFKAGTTLIVNKLKNKIDRFMQITKYLAFVVTLSKDSTLNDLYSSDRDTMDQLKEIIQSLAVAAGSYTNQIDYKGKTYNLDDNKSAREFNNVLDNLINNSHILQSKWYKVVSELKSKGYLEPTGNFISFGIGWDWPNKDITNPNLHLASYILGGNYDYNKLNPYNSGQQLAKIILNMPTPKSSVKESDALLTSNNTIYTVIPIVDAEGASSNTFYFMDSNGKTSQDLYEQRYRLRSAYKEDEYIVPMNRDNTDSCINLNYWDGKSTIFLPASMSAYRSCNAGFTEKVVFTKLVPTLQNNGLIFKNAELQAGSADKLNSKHPLIQQFYSQNN